MTAHHRPHRPSFIDTRSLVFWVGLGLFIFGLIQLVPFLVRNLSVFPAAGVLSAILWVSYGAVLMVILYRLELFERRSPVTILGAFAWGGVVVAGIGFIAAPAMHDLFAKILGPDLQDWVAAFSAPLVEEPLKMLGVVALAFIPGARINSALDGLFFGLVVGLGFEVTESFMYTTQGSAAEGGDFTMVVLTFILRGIVGGLWNHPTFTAITGAGVGYFFSGRGTTARRWTVMLGALVAAMVLHGFFDSPLFEFGNPFLTSIIKGVPAFVMLVVLIRMARRRERDLFAGVVHDSLPADLISEDEMETLLHKHDRKKARKRLRKQSGLAAAHALKRLQRAQIELVVAIEDNGSGSPEAIALADEVREDREVFESVVAGDSEGAAAG